jgi:Bacterial Ig domain
VIILANADNESVEPLAIKLAGFYEPSLTIPPFTLTAGVPTQPLQKGEPVSFTIHARDDGHAAPGTLLEIEIWNADNKPVYKDHRENQNFGEGQSNTYSFSWTPATPGTYTVNVGVYGPKWMADKARWPDVPSNTISHSGESFTTAAASTSGPTGE